MGNLELLSAFVTSDVGGAICAATSGAVVWCLCRLWQDWQERKHDRQLNTLLGRATTVRRDSYSEAPFRRLPRPY